MTRLTLLALVPLCLALSGCGGNDATLSGKVTFQGKPVTSGAVVVLNADRTSSQGVIGPDGSNRVRGVGRGPVRLAVVSDNAPRKAAGKAKGPAHLPHAVANPGTSGLACEVTASRFEYDIAVK